MMRRLSKSVPDSSRSLKHGDDTLDRINDLPESILGHILSLLPAKIAVATSILSKRWKFLWTTAGNLDFCCPKNYTRADVKQFVQFVYYVLLLHKPGYFNKLSLSWEKGCIPLHVHTWIRAAVTRDVHELIVHVDISKLPIHVQSYMFSSERLKSLELKCSICINPEIVVSLPRLETLKLISIYFRSEEAFRKLLDGCPVLKHLVIHMDIGEMIRYGYVEMVDGVAFKCIISSASLTHLELLAYDKYPTTEGYSALCGVRLDAPSLRYIKLEDQINSIVLQESFNFLVEANIQLTHFEYKTEVPNYCNSFVEALHAFDCAKTLILSDEVVRALSCGTIKMTTRFNRLTRLEVSMYWKYWSSLQDFIELSENLEVLIIKKKEHDDDDEDDDDDDEDEDEDDLNNSNWKKPNIVPRCLSNSLKTVSIGCYYGHEIHHDEFEMISYILEHGSVLQDMQICLDESIIDSELMNVKLAQMISTFRRIKSPVCEVKFCDESLNLLCYALSKMDYN